MTGLLVFLRARLEDDGDAAPNVHASDCASLPPEPAAEDDTHDGVGWRRQPCDCGRPARVLAEVKSKRLIIEWCIAAQDRMPAPAPLVGMNVLAALALPYDSHPDYDESWRP